MGKVGDYMNDKLYEAARSQGVGIPSDIDDDDGVFRRFTPCDESNVLHVAAECGNQGFILAVLDRVPATIHYELLCKQNSEGETPLHLAAQNGDKGTIEALLLAHDKDCATPLINEKKHCWSEKDKQGNTPLHTALKYGHDDIATLLLERDMKVLVSIDNDMGESPTYLAVANSCMGFLKWVLEADRHRECCASFSGPFGQTAFHPAWKLNGDIMSKLIETRRHVLKAQDKRGKTALHYAVEEKRVSIIETLLKADSSLAYLHDEDGLTPLHKAASMGSILMIQTIMELSPQSIRIRDKRHGRTALHLAKMDACSLKECLRNTRMKELINQVDNDRNTPLHLALINSDLLTADKLLDVQDINWRLTNKEGNCPMDLCSFDYHITRKLKRLAVDQSRIKDGVNMEIFFHKAVVNVEDVLDHYSWDKCLTYLGPEGDNIFHVAARDGQMKIIRRANESNSALTLLLSGQDSTREIPLHLAAQHGRLAVVRFILSLCTSVDKPVNDNNPLVHNPRSVESPSTAVAIGNEGGNHRVNDENPSTIVTLDNGDGNHIAGIVPWRMKSANGDTPAHKAVRNRHPNITLLLLKQDPELISFTNNAKESLLYLAVDNECIPVVEHILSVDREFDDLTTSGRDGQNVFHAVATNRGATLLDNCVIKKPELLGMVDVNGKTPLHYAVEHNNHSAVTWLLKKDKSAAFVYDNEGFTPLMRAATFGLCSCMMNIIDLCPESAKLLDLRNGRTVLHLAKMSGFSLSKCMTYKVMMKLVNETDEDGNTALHRAILDGDIDKALLLLETKDLNWRIKNKQHQSPWYLCLELKRSGKTEQRPVHVGLASLHLREELMPCGLNMISWVWKKLIMAYSNMIMTEDNAKKLTDNIAVASGLLLTITSAAAFAIPGGYNQYTGNAMRVKQAAVQGFMASDVLAMLMCVSILVRYTLVGGRRDQLKKLALDSIIMLQISLLATVLGFASAAYAIGSPFNSIITTPIVVAVLLNLVIFFRPDFFEYIF